MILRWVVTAILVAAAVSLAVLPGAMPVQQLGGWGDRGESGGAGFTPSLAPAASSGTTQTGTAQQHVSAQQIFNRTNTVSPFGGNSTVKNYTFDLAPYSTIYQAGMSFLVSVPQGEYARILLMQGGTVLVNTTAPSFSVTPSISTTPVRETVLAVMNQNGTIPATGRYPVFTNETSTIQFALFASAGWTYSKIYYQESLTTFINTSFGYWLNATTLSVPFPTAISVNYTSLLVTANGTSVAYQVSPTSLFVLIQNLAPGAWLKIVSSFTPAPVAMPPNPVIVMPAPIIAGATYTESYYWTNAAIPAYNGLYTLQLQQSSPLAISTVALKVNGVQYAATTFAISGSNLTILPGVLTSYEGQAVLFVVSFQHQSSGIPVAGNSLVVVSGAGYTITLGEILLVAAGLLVLYVVVRVLDRPHPRPQDIRDQWKLIAILIALLAVYGAGAL